MSSPPPPPFFVVALLKQSDSGFVGLGGTARTLSENGSEIAASFWTSTPAVSLGRVKYPRTTFY